MERQFPWFRLWPGRIRHDMKQEHRTDLAEQMRVLFELSPSLMGVTDRAGRYRLVNAAWREQLGYSLEDVATIPYTALIHPDDRSGAVPPPHGGGPRVVELRHRRKDGSYVWLDWSISASPDTGEIYTIGRDISARKELGARLEEVESKFADLVENADDVICTADLEGNFTSLNKAAERISGYSSSEVIGMPFEHFVAPEYHPLVKQMTELKLAGRDSTIYEVELLTKNGRRIPIELNTRLMFENGKPVGIQGIARDSRMRKKLEDDLRRRNEELEEANTTIRSLMNEDSLTKLANRRSLEDTLAKAISLAKRSGHPLTLVLCDVDRFKSINDNFGHAAGDEILSAFGGLLGISCRKEDTAARYGGEEFVLLLPNTPLEAAIEFAERVRIRTESLSVPSGARITASFGVTAFTPEDTSDTFISRADAALYLAKERGRNQVISDKSAERSSA